MNNAKWTTGVLVGGVLLLGASGAWAQDWPQWRGPNRDNKVTGFTAPATWPKELAQKWKVPVGDGDASPVLVGDKVYVFTREGGDEVIRCLDAGNGKELWQDKYAQQPAQVPMGGHKGPRSTPAVADGKVCALGVGGILSCLDADSGKVVWRKDSKDKPRFYTASSPLIVDGKCVAYLGGEGKGEVVAYDLASGDEKWKWPGEGPPYGSPVLMTVDGAKQVVTLTQKSLVGIDAADGKLLWQVPFSSRYNSCTPIVDGQTVICSSPGGGRMGGGGGGGGGAAGGTVAWKIEKEGDKVAAKELWKKPQAAGMYNTPVLKDGLLYALGSGGGSGGGGGGGRPGMGRGAANFFCMDAKTGDVLWTDKTQRGECGEVLDAGSVLLALTSNQELVAFEPGNKEYKEVAHFKVADKPTWAYPIVSGNRVFVKDADSLALWTIP
jgi:outer membrane protein assembly factor BamB